MVGAQSPNDDGLLPEPDPLAVCARLRSAANTSQHGKLIPSVLASSALHLFFLPLLMVITVSFADSQSVSGPERDPYAREWVRSETWLEADYFGSEDEEDPLVQTRLATIEETVDTGTLPGKAEMARVWVAKKNVFPQTEISDPQDYFELVEYPKALAGDAFTESKPPKGYLPHFVPAGFPVTRGHFMMRPLSQLPRCFELREGSGEQAKAGDRLQVHYTGWLHTGKQFDSSVNHGPFEFTLGAGTCIKGWEEGLKGMKVGGKRVLIIPPELGYGKKGAGDVIPPDAELIFEVELLKIKK
jgi:hypothetical protein